MERVKKDRNYPTVCVCVCVCTWLVDLLSIDCVSSGVG